MLKKKELIDKLNFHLESKLIKNGFSRFSPKNVEYKKSVGQIDFKFICIIEMKTFGPIRGKICTKIDPYISVENAIFSSLYASVFKVEENPENDFPMLSAPIHSIVSNPTGRRIVKDSFSEYFIYDYSDNEIENLCKNISSEFELFGLPFYERFNNLNSIFQELSQTPNYSSVFSWITTRRLISAIIVGHLLNTPDLKALAKQYKVFFEQLNHRQSIEHYNTLCFKLFGEKFI